MNLREIITALIAEAESNGLPETVTALLRAKNVMIMEEAKKKQCQA